MDCVTVYPAKRRAKVLAWALGVSAQAPRRKASPLQALAQAPQNLAPAHIFPMSSAVDKAPARQTHPTLPSPHHPICSSSLLVRMITVMSVGNIVIPPLILRIFFRSRCHRERLRRRNKRRLRPIDITNVICYPIRYLGR